jgi:DNA mismatch repair protein MutL
LRDSILRKRIADLLGKNANDRLVPIDEFTDIVGLKGFVLKPEFSKKTRGEQFFFVNDRFFKSSYFHHAVTKSFDGLLKEGYFPSYFIYLDVVPQKIDVNVHPTKTEIKFEEEKFIYSILLSSIRQALGKFNIAPTLDFDRESSFDLPLSMRGQPINEPEIRVNPNFNPFTSVSSRSTNSVSNGFTKAIHNEGFGKERDFDQKDWANFYEIKEEVDIPANQLEQLIGTELSYVVKGNYIVVPIDTGFLVIHARRAYELLIYTEASKKFIIKPLNSQTLLFPLEIELSRNQENLWVSNEILLRQLGFVFELEKQELALSAVPDFLEDETIRPCVDEILSTLEYEDLSARDIAQSVLMNMAKTAAMKRLDLQNKEATKLMIEQLFSCDEFAHTPDGRKVVSLISLDEMGNKFN